MSPIYRESEKLQKLELNGFKKNVHEVLKIFVIGVTGQKHSAFCYINQWCEFYYYLIERDRCPTMQKQSKVVNINGVQGLFKWFDCVRRAPSSLPSFTNINSRG